MTIITPVAKADAFPRGTAVVIVSYDGRFAGQGRVQSFLPGSVYSVELTGGYDDCGKPFRVGSIEFFHAGFVARVEDTVQPCGGGEGMTEVAKFLADGARNRWIRSPGISAYIRRGERIHEGQRVKTFDIANIEVTGEKRTGIFSRWYDEVVSSCRDIGIGYVYIESIMSPVMEEFCVKRGFELSGVRGLAPSYIKKI